MTAAIANGPVGFTDTAGKQLFIPLSAIYFDAAGAVKADKWPLFTANQAAVEALLASLVKNKIVTPGPADAPKSAMIVKAKDPGGAGNNIRLVFSNVTVNSATPGNSTLDMNVTETDTYTGLKPDTIAAMLGKDATPGSKPGLVHLKGATVPALPKAGDYQLAGGGAAAKSSKDIDKNTGSGAAFTLEAKRDGADGDKIKVTIKDVNTTDQTFTLVAVWAKNEAAVKVSDIATKFEYELEVAAPTGGTLAAPVAGAVSLAGGKDSQGPTNASATVMAAS